MDGVCRTEGSLRDRLSKKYPGCYKAVLERRGRLVDHDEDLTTLVDRLKRRYTRAIIFIWPPHGLHLYLRKEM